VRLIRSSNVGTGAEWSPTPGGVFKTTYKQPGWYTEGYDVRPVVRFTAGVMPSTPGSTGPAPISWRTIPSAIRSATAACACMTRISVDL
jgi:hypothetical protein